MKGFLYFIISVCAIYIICPDPIPIWFDDFVVFGILILAAIGVKKLPSNRDNNSNYDEEEEEEEDNEDEDNDDDSYQELTVYNYYAPGKTINLNCSHCGASLDLDLDNLLARCPYCNHKILIDTALLGTLIAEKGRTQREEERTRRKREIEEERTRKEKEITERERLKYQYELDRQREEAKAKEREARRNSIQFVIGMILLIFFFFILPRLL